jgi:hypothetical protein
LLCYRQHGQITMRSNEEYELLLVALQHVNAHVSPLAFVEICLNAMCLLHDQKEVDILSAIANGTIGVDKAKKVME